MPRGVSGSNFVEGGNCCTELVSYKQSWRKFAWTKEMAVFRLECRGLLGAGQEFLRRKASKEHQCFLRRLRLDHACLVHNVHQVNIKYCNCYRSVSIVRCHTSVCYISS
ncbi:hypothetical protein M758_4G185600 [Ceratodon purpureus]|uniref:Uncharacterized protein n=1 Tax=Ceratodon purpureus TaxID=3225 RepID=A0A8T0ICE4_CERPU|nr:hypothetical protein KC19_4G183000 [Ceratodon purpureus]KAG0620054.1 hypothetical protein M758_4G185600 [Ceratodon purpureus]